MESKILTFLTELEANNNRDWYHDHKADYKAANEEFETLIQSLIQSLAETEPELLRYAPKELTFKLNRDTRFSHDKSPYNPSFRCHISKAGKLPIPVGNYLMIRPGNRSFLGGGLFADMFKDATQMVRSYIAGHIDELETILSTPPFDNSMKIQGTALKHLPRDFASFDPEHPLADFLKYKSWYIEVPFADTALGDSSAFVEFATQKFLLMKPFNDFLNRALDGFQMPQR